MHLAIELITFAFFLACLAHAGLLRGRAGIALFAGLLLLGWVREDFVLLAGLLYGFAPLHLMLGKAPLIATVIWGYSIYAALTFAEAWTGERTPEHRPSAAVLAAVAVFMMALACFYEPVLHRLRMARWEEGTRTVLDVPLIALAGYPSLACAFLLLWAFVLRRLGRWPARTAVLILALPTLGLAHAAGLQALKRLLGW